MLLSFFSTIGSTVLRLKKSVRVLVVEDSFMAARSLVRLLESLGVEVIGPAPSVSHAMQLLDSQECDLAILDINLGNETVEAVAQRLEAAGRPFFFVSGYASPLSVLHDSRLHRRKLLAKPIDPRQIEQAITESIQPGGERGPQSN